MSKYGRVYHLYVYANINNLPLKAWTEIAVVDNMSYKPVINHYFYLVNGGILNLSPIYFGCFNNSGAISIYPLTSLGHICGDCVYIQ